MGLRTLRDLDLEHLGAYAYARTSSRIWVYAPRHPKPRAIPSFVPFSFFLHAIESYIYSMIRINSHIAIEEGAGSAGSDLAHVTDLIGRVHTISLHITDVMTWRSGELIQRAMPYLSSDERELLISGIPGDMYDRMYDPDR
jgi:hypothetical protein